MTPESIALKILWAPNLRQSCRRSHDMPEATLDRDRACALLNRILEAELAGVVRYTHYSFMVYGYNRIPIVSWLREQATESMVHAQQAGELITALGEHPSLAIGPLLETHKHDVGDILREAYDNEKQGLQLYRELLTEVDGKSVMLEEYARTMIYQEETHLYEVDKMLRKPGDVASFGERK
jgi:bacterioferritin